MAGNTNLHLAAKAKKDEFYTQLSDIERELFHYREHFNGKTILCNCDDPYESNFFKFFVLNFNFFNLKKLICTCYSGSPIAGKELSLFGSEEKEEKQRIAYKMIVDKVEDFNKDGAVDLTDIQLLLKQGNIITELKENGDFRSKECIELLQQADIVVTNPPFSLFREYVAQLTEYDKKFIIIGSQNAITYKEIFKLIKEDKLWLGYGFNNGNAYFKTPVVKDFAKGVYDKDTDLVKFRNICWFTNLDIHKRHQPLQLMTMEDNLKFSRHKEIREKGYLKYDNYDAIEVPYTDAIPSDYKGEMGVPVTFMNKYCPEQFEILGLDNHTINNG
ncbi:MAG: adenine-specific methyltransferase EcoRI family protein, partial [Bacteroidota bacterium]|nr:adenine-specific methyltransferase EcoRI family protein [Bacteroidota bacterium]